MKRIVWGFFFAGLLVFFCNLNTAFSQDVTININAAANKKAVSPLIYGSNVTFNKPVSFFKDVGLRFARVNGGNNATKYNWRKKLTSHPDWYNNVYGCDWDATSKSIAKNYPDMKVMWAFQLIGRVASSNAYNFGDWAYNRSNWWEGVHQNLAGGGIPDTINPGSDGQVEGDINLYTVEWPADSTVEILNHWFGANGLGLKKSQFLYWNMDNEADVWNGTHDDVMDTLITASEFMDRYIEVAKKARAIFPEIKLCGPVTTSEWQWFKWSNENIRVNGQYYCFLEYFIKRLAEEEKSSGIRLLDVVDLHNYPYAPANSDAVQLHRMYYDKNYVYPGANGLKTIFGGWDNSLTKEYIFQRINDWLLKHYGPDHGITLGISEWSPAASDANVVAVVYASHLGTFANNGVEYLTPWSWFNGMWETMHLFSRYAREYSVSSSSSNETKLSAYTTINEAADSMTIIIVNRDLSASKNVTVKIAGFEARDGRYPTLQLSSLPTTETFKSHTNNALKKDTVSVDTNTIAITVPSLSVTAVLLTPLKTGYNSISNRQELLKLYPNPVSDQLQIEMNPGNPCPINITITDPSGRIIKTYSESFDGHSPFSLDVSSIPTGYFFISVKSIYFTDTRGIVIQR
jgi:hypothetical protein